jgi:hypothetical protein
MRGAALMSDGKDLREVVTVQLRVEEPGLPYGHEKEIQIDPELWDSMTEDDRREYIEDRLDEFAAEVYETDWEITSGHALDEFRPEE